MEKTKSMVEDLVLISFFAGFFIFCARYVLVFNNLGDRIFIIAIATYSAGLAAIFFSCFTGWIKRHQIHILNHKITLYIFIPFLAIAILIKCFS